MRRPRGVSPLLDTPLLVWRTDGRICGADRHATKTLVPVCCSTVRMDNRPDPDRYRRLPFRHEDAGCYLTDKDGQFVEALVDGSYRLQTYCLCLNNPLTVKRLLSLIGQVMEEGPDGVVLRFRNPPQACHAENLHVGFVERFRSVACQVPWMSVYDRRILELDAHDHLHADSTQLSAFESFAAKARRVVKRYGKHKALVVETEGTCSVNADGHLIASRLADLPHTLRVATANGRGPLLAAVRLDRPRAAEDVFFAVAMSWLYGAACVLPRVATARFFRTAVPALGPRVTPPATFGGVTYSVHKDGVVAANVDDHEQILRLKLPRDYNHGTLTDLRTARTVRVEPGGTVPDISIHDYADRHAADKDLLVRMPPRSGRIFCRRRRRA